MYDPFSFQKDQSMNDNNNSRQTELAFNLSKGFQLQLLEGKVEDPTILLCLFYVGYSLFEWEKVGLIKIV